MIDFNKVYLFRMTNIENIPHILKYGITHPKSKNANKKYIGIGDQTIIDRRKDKVFIDNKRLGDFIPFYFSYRTPMLLVIQTGYNGVERLHPSNIVYCVTSVKKVLDIDIDFFFTDGHPINAITSVHRKEEIDNLFDIIDKEAIDSRKWSNDVDIDLKRKKEAEFLIEDDFPIENIIGFVVYDDEAKNKMSSFGVIDDKVVIRKNYYYDKF